MPLSFELDNAQKEYLGRQATLAIQSVLDGDSDAAPSIPRQLQSGVRGKP